MTIYLKLNQAITTKYLKEGGEGTDIDQLAQDVDELKSEMVEVKQDIAGIEEVDETQNEIIDKLRHQIILASGYYDNGIVKLISGNLQKSFVISCDTSTWKNGNISGFSNSLIYSSIYNVDDENELRFLRNSQTSEISSSNYYYYKNSSIASENAGFVILNGLGEQVLNNHLVQQADVPTGQNIKISDLINLYGTDYYKEHVNDTFYYDLIETNVLRITNLYYWFRSGYSSSLLDNMTNLNNWVNSKVSAYDPTNSIKTDLTSTWTSSDYETMTNLKDWVESKAGGTTPTTIIKCPVDMYISNDGMTTTYTDHQVPFRISNTYKLGGSTADSSGYYIAFHSDSNKQFNRIVSITVLAIKSGQTFPTFSWDSLCKFYKCDFSTDDANKYGGIYFIMNDGTTCYSHEIGRSAFLLNQPKYVHFLSDTIRFNALKNNVCSNVGNAEIEASTSTYDTSRKPYYRFNGSEGSFTGTDALYSETE